jgi:NAD(P)H-dependent FMN reductase
MSQIRQLVVVIGSVRKDRIGPVVARWLLGRVASHNATQVDVIDLDAIDLPDDLGNGGDAVMFRKRIDGADGFIVVTPEYNRGYPGTLKTAIDTAVTEWHAKPVGFVSYGGMSGGMRAVEQLRPVFAELHAVTMQAVVAVPFVWDQIDQHGHLCPPERAASAAATLLRQLTWWAWALRHAKARHPYQP